jgi:predicted metal-binding membrane protein
VTAIVLVRRQGEAALARLQRLGWRHPEWLAALVAGWAWMTLMALHGPNLLDERALARDQIGHELGGWLVMAVAMMVPSTLPEVHHVAFNSLWHRRQWAMAVFVGSYLAVWALFGLVALPIAAGARALVPGGGDADFLVAAVLMVAAAWELTPVKRRALRACHLTIPLPPLGRKADIACARFGLRHGRSCVVGCWAVMLAMAAAGHGSLLLMALLTTIVLAEKVAVQGTRFVRPAALALLGAAAVVAVK